MEIHSILMEMICLSRNKEGWSFLIFAVLLSLVCCTPAQEYEMSGERTGTIQSITALIENPSFPSKTAMTGKDGQYSISWCENDRISLVSSEGHISEFVTEQGDGQFSLAAGNAPVLEAGSEYLALYPSGASCEGGRTVQTLPATQVYAEGSCASGSYPMAAESSVSDAQLSPLYFKGTCGILRLFLKVPGSPVSVQSVMVSSSSVPLSGRFAYDAGLLVPAEGEPASGVLLDCSSAGGVDVDAAGKAFFIVLPVGIYTDLSIEVRTPLHSCRFVLASGRSIQIARARFTDLSLTATRFNHRYEVPEGGVQVLSYQEAKSHSNDKADLTQLFERNNPNSLFGVTDFGATGYGSDDGRSYKAVVLHYPTHDAQGNIVWASGRVYHGCDKDGKAIVPEHIVLDSHYTIGSSAEAPSRFYTFDVGIALQKGLVVAPDYIGYGLSSSMDHPYLCYDLCAENALDMVRAAKSYLKAQGAKIPDDIDFYSIGYSQGGGTALGVMRYIQNHGLSSEFNLKNTYCGGGLYNPETFFTSMVDSGNSAYPAGLPLMIMGMKTAYPELITDSLESYFTPAFNAAGIFEMIRGKQFDVDQIAAAICKAVGGNSATSVKTSLILSSAAMDSSSSQYRNLMAAFERQDLRSGWSSAPEGKVMIFHYKSDEVVNIEQYNLINDAFKSNSGFTFEKQEYSVAGLINSNLACHRGYAGVYYARMISGAYLISK